MLGSEHLISGRGQALPEEQYALQPPSASPADMLPFSLQIIARSLSLAIEDGPTT